MSRDQALFGPDTLLERMACFPVPTRYWIGFSGGADSTALLLALHEITGLLKAPVHAVHFDHGLAKHSADWAEHCRSFCQQRNIPFHARALDLGTFDLVVSNPPYVAEDDFRSLPAEVRVGSLGTSPADHRSE